MEADEIRRVAKEFLESGKTTEDEPAIGIVVTLLSELAAHTAELSLVFAKGNVNVDARVREGSHGH